MLTKKTSPVSPELAQARVDPQSVGEASRAVVSDVTPARKRNR